MNSGGDGARYPGRAPANPAAVDGNPLPVLITALAVLSAVKAIEKFLLSSFLTVTMLGAMSSADLVTLPVPCLIQLFDYSDGKILIPVVAGNHLGMVHQIPEGHVGVYWRGGALLKTISGPGFHLMLPFLTHYEPIQVTIQTDQVKDIPCGTKGGVMIYFEKIEVVNRLNRDYVYDTILNYGVSYDKTWIYDKVHHEINQFCSSHSLQEVYIDQFDQIDETMKEVIQRDCTKYAPGIEIIGVRVTKPKIPPSIARNYEIMEEERTKVMIAVEKQKVAEKEAETLKKRAVTDAEKEAEVSKIFMEQRVMEKESLRRQHHIEDEMFLAREKSLADANYYRVMQEAEANKLKLTPAYLELRFIESIANNTKIFYGEKIPSMVYDQRLPGSFLSDTR